MSDKVNFEQKAQWILRILSYDVRRSGAPSSPTAYQSQGRTGSTPDGQDIPGLAAWQSARATAVQSLDQLEAAFRMMDEPEVPKAIILLAAIRANLTPQPATRQQVEELRRYIEQDEKIEEAEMPNGFGFTVSLRTPLLAALSQLAPRG